MKFLIALITFFSAGASFAQVDSFTVFHPELGCDGYYAWSVSINWQVASKEDLQKTFDTLFSLKHSAKVTYLNSKEIGFYWDGKSDPTLEVKAILSTISNLKDLPGIYIRCAGRPTLNPGMSGSSN